VRIHTDNNAMQSARDLNANAYTTGNNIVFGGGKFSPESQHGKHLLAHELTHVVQQVGSPAQLQRQSADGSNTIDFTPPISGCTKDQSKSLDRLTLLASGLVTGAIGDLEGELKPSPSGIITRARSALLANFHTEDPKDIQSIIATFKAILNRLNTRNIRCLPDDKCDQVCAGDGAPFACASRAIPITVCSGVFNRTHSTHPLFYATVLIHEAGHQVGKERHTYEPRDQKAIPDARRLALRSADSYANFAEDRSLAGRGSLNFFRR